MALKKETVRTPEAVGHIRIVLDDPDPALKGETVEATYEFVIKFDDGSAVRRRGNLGPELSATERTQILAFLEAQRTKAESTLD